MIIRVLSTGLLAGFLAGVAIAALQNFTTTPLILAAEVFENAEKTAAAVSSDEARVILVHSKEEHGAAAGEAEEWAPGDGAERIFYTSTATVATAIGFAFLLLAGMLVSGDAIDERQAIAWAAAAFVATGLAPAAGLSPELPGMPAADLVSRQAWWFLTATLTALSIWLFLRSEQPVLKLLAVALLLAPHILGAPHLNEVEASKVPPDLSARFAAMSLAIQAALWIATGFAVGMLWPWLARRGADTASAN